MLTIFSITPYPWQMKLIYWSQSKNLFKQIFGLYFPILILSPYIKLKRKKSVCTFSITVYSYPTKNGQFRLRGHPIVLDDIFNKLFQNVVHFVHQGRIYVFGF